MRNVATVLMVLTAVGIGWYKFRIVRTCTDICRDKNGRYLLDEHKFLEASVRAGHRQIAPLHLFVFVEPLLDCPSCLREADRWIEPATSAAGSFEYSLVMSQRHRPDNQPFFDHFHIDEEQVHYLPEGHPFLGYHRFGVLKVLVKDGREVLWFELGSKSPQEYQQFSARVDAAILNFQ